MPDLRKPNFNTKMTPFEKSHNAGNCERGDPLGFFNIHSVFNKKILLRNFNGSLKVPKNLKGPFGIF